MDFRRSLSRGEYNSWLGLLESLKDCTLTDNRADCVQWVLDPKKTFSTKSLYRFRSHGGAISQVAGHLWKSKIPMKIKFFMWQMLHNKLQVAENLIKRKWKGSICCCLCGMPESVNHVFFECHLARMCWGIIKEVFQLTETPRSVDELCSGWLKGKGPLSIRLTIFLFAGFAWAIWTTRNKMAIEKVFPKAPTDVIFVALSLMQKWRVSLKEKEQGSFDSVSARIVDWMKQFKPTQQLMSDVVEI